MGPKPQLSGTQPLPSHLAHGSISRRWGSKKKKGKLSIKPETYSLDAETSGIRGEPMSTSKQPCRRRDGGMEVDGEMEVASIKTQTLSIKITTQPEK